ncbi:MAG: translation initiation factor IF-2 N-terminal domain-containing protein, partial [Bryobacteraceae bacterium]
MKKIRINELARECEQPNSVILALLPQFGITEKKTHSSSIDEETADKIRRYFGIVVERGEAEAAPAAEAPAVTEAPAAPAAEGKEAGAETAPAPPQEAAPQACPGEAAAAPAEKVAEKVEPPRTPDLGAIIARPAR